MTAREMQRRSAKARWSGKSAEDRRREMSALAKARWAKRQAEKIPAPPAFFRVVRGKELEGDKLKEFIQDLRKVHSPQ